MPRKDDDERFKVTVRLKITQVKRAQHYAIDQDTTLQALVEQALETLLKKAGR
jgi:hypothetical protein